MPLSSFWVLATDFGVNPTFYFFLPLFLSSIVFPCDFGGIGCSVAWESCWGGLIMNDACWSTPEPVSVGYRICAILMKFLSTKFTPTLGNTTSSSGSWISGLIGFYSAVSGVLSPSSLFAQALSFLFLRSLVLILPGAPVLLFDLLTFPN